MLKHHTLSSAMARMALLATVATVAAGTALSAHAQVRLGAYAIPGVFEADKSGDYDKVLARLAASGGPKLDYVVAPPARLEDDFKAGKLDCIIPLDARFWVEPGKFVNSEPLNIAKIYIFSRAADGPYTSVAQLKGKKVGARRGMPYGPKFDAAGLTVDLVTEDNLNVQKLLANRIDAFVAYVPDMWQWAADKKQPLPHHDAAKPLETHKDAFLCKDSPAARDFVKAFDAATVKLRGTGELQKMLGASYVP
jgi:ABC-type amino acid transport substrate-binding protein